ncbi:hypothetical protein R3W88_008285 [Solanum pinnatisectum]|uniref:Clp R domain-containing protein n=1 Tax=Solanum pinnatisectum TaxID=50273 RepID=A0AAV9MA72_9SOLN|nr:hypothetical protein R3W88_008285 [Solanum pinnatisectum]
MAKALVQSISIPSSAAASERDGQFNRSWKHQTSVRMNSFVGLRGGNVLLVKSGKTLHSKVAMKRPQGCRIVSEAKYECTTKKVIKVLMLAQEESRRLSHNLIGTEQILLGLIGEETGTVAKVLKSMRINLRDACIEVEKIIGKGSGFVVVRIPLSSRAKHNAMSIQDFYAAMSDLWDQLALTESAELKVFEPYRFLLFRRPCRLLIFSYEGAVGVSISIFV